MAYYSNTDTAFNAINSWTKDAAEASIKITDYPSAYLNGIKLKHNKKLSIILQMDHNNI